MKHWICDWILAEAAFLLYGSRWSWCADWNSARDVILSDQFLILKTQKTFFATGIPGYLLLLWVLNKSPCFGSSKKHETNPSHPIVIGPSRSAGSGASAGIAAPARRHAERSEQWVGCLRSCRNREIFQRFMEEQRYWMESLNKLRIDEKYTVVS